MKTILLTHGEHDDYRVLELFSCANSFDIESTYDDYRKHVKEVQIEIEEKRCLHLPGCQMLRKPTFVEYLTERELISPLSYEEINIGDIELKHDLAEFRAALPNKSA